MGLKTRIDRFTFRGAYAPPAVASRDGGPWNRITVQTGGTPTVRSGSGGAMELTLDSTNEAQSAGLYMGNILPYDIDDLIRVTALAKVTALLNAVCTAVIGVASAQNATPDSVAEHAWFRLQGSNALLVETDDGTSDNDDVATGFSLSTTYRRLQIDFASGLKTVGPPSASKGGKAQVLFSVSDDMGSLRPVARSTSFDMSAYAGNLQLIAQLQKTANAAVATLSILEFEVEYRLPNAA
jgi:hypothetical protein